MRSLAIKCSACAGLYVAGRGLRMTSSKTVNPTQLAGRPVLKTNHLGPHIQVAHIDIRRGRTRPHAWSASCRTLAARRLPSELRVSEMECWDAGLRGRKHHVFSHK